MMLTYLKASINQFKWDFYNNVMHLFLWKSSSRSYTLWIQKISRILCLHNLLENLWVNLTFALFLTDYGMFSMNASTGVITLTHPLDREQNETLYLFVQVGSVFQYKDYSQLKYFMIFKKLTYIFLMGCMKWRSASWKGIVNYMYPCNYLSV